ncbi:MAG: cysteine hydrolase [Pirellulaceae bacterium]
MSQANPDAVQQTIVYGRGRRPDAAIPRPELKLRRGHVGIVVTDPQNDFLTPQGVAWGVVGRNVAENRTVENIGRLFSLAKELDIPLFISPHYYFPHDHNWRFEGALERLMHDIRMFDRPGPLDTTQLDGSGADWVEQYKPLINDGETIVCSPHKVYGPQSNDLVLQLRKRRIEQVILAGMSANVCVESHLRELLEQGFEVAVVGDATAAAQLPGFDGYEAAITNFRFLASDLWSTGEAVARLSDIRYRRSAAPWRSACS